MSDTTTLGDDLIALLDRRSAPPLSFRAFLESPDYCALSLSTAVAAIADAADGALVTTIDDETSERLFGCELAGLPRRQSRTVVVRAGGRGGKTSRLLAPKALHAAWTAPLPTVMPGEHARSLLIAPTKDLAVQALAYVRGYIDASPTLTTALERDTTECITLRRPDGNMVDIAIGAATRGAKAARGRTLVFAGLDEAAFFYADDGYTATDKEIYRAAIQRIVEGGQLWLVSTPWIEGVGVMEERLTEDLGRHEKSLVAIGGTRDLNPSWDPTGEIERDMRDDDPDNAAREIDAVPLSAGTRFFFPPEAVKLSTKTGRVDDLEPNGSRHYGGTDLGFSKNSSALAIARLEDDVVRLAYRVEMRPGKGEALKPSAVCAAFADRCIDYSAQSMKGDLHYIEAAREHLEGTGVTYARWVPTPESKAEVFTEFRRRMAEGRLELPKDPRLLSQIRQTTGKAMEGGMIKIALPKQGQAHGDLLMAVVLACVQPPLEEREKPRAPSPVLTDFESGVVSVGPRRDVVAGLPGARPRGSVKVTPFGGGGDW